MQHLSPELTLAGYSFVLPDSLIAQQPAQRREDSRLLVLQRQTGHVQQAMFTDIVRYLPENCLLIVNNSKVIPARMYGRRPSGGRVEFLLLTPPPLLEVEPAYGYAAHCPEQARAQSCSATAPMPTQTAARCDTAQASVQSRQCAASLAQGSTLVWSTALAEGLLRSSKKVPIGERLVLAHDLCVEVVERGEFGRCRVRLFWQGEFLDILQRIGTLPLPPYIRRQPAAMEDDAVRYQTVYAQAEKSGSVAAPTAGLHFTHALKEAVLASGRQWAEVTLYVGYGTFSPVRSADIREHAMHAEYVELPLETTRAIAQAKAEGRPVIAVGTTSARVLEGVSGLQGDSPLSPHTGWINIFLYPGKEFRVIDGLITNFHLPESSLLMLVSAFAGHENVKNAYQYAIAEGFRFFSYGDAMLIV